MNYWELFVVVGLQVTTLLLSLFAYLYARNASQWGEINNRNIHDYGQRQK